MSAYDAIVQACLLRSVRFMMTTRPALSARCRWRLKERHRAEFGFHLGCSIIGGLLLQPVLTLYTDAGDLPLRSTAEIAA